ncbi:alpha-1A adrenergic receptor-like [Paramacrobiotus metropolitanus]|uniref:alpha-1A adrenergic receptor-like n=1 Tax=Paramacrobiotus metropolitanus TaxID=2943436 RepID=UPI002445A23A|nr:alpha-1A adrenergic receptor-like [Paramacrobiotus metropolitanus]
MSNLSLYVINRTQLGSTNITLDNAHFVTYMTVSSFSCLFTIVVYLLLTTLTFWRRFYLTGSRFLLVHQFLAELLMVGVHWPLLLLQMLLARHGIFTSNKFCRHFFFFYVVNMMAALWGLCALSFNRFIAIVYPHLYARFTRRRFLLAQVVSFWILGIAIHLPFYVDGSGFVAESPWTLCNFARQGGLMFDIAATLRVHLPLAVAGVMHVIVLCQVAASRRQIHRSAADAAASAPGSAAYRKRVMLAKMLFANWIVHCMCFATLPMLKSVLPLWVFRQMMTLPWLRDVFYAGYLSTPVLFYAMNKECREVVNSVLMCATVTEAKPEASMSYAQSHKGQPHTAFLKTVAVP